MQREVEVGVYDVEVIHDLEGNGLEADELLVGVSIFVVLALIFVVFVDVSVFILVFFVDIYVFIFVVAILVFIFVIDVFVVLFVLWFILFFFSSCDQVLDGLASTLNLRIED